MSPQPPTGAPQARPPGPLHERVLGLLGEAIVHGDHPAGTVLRIEELEARYGVSRTVVREAVKVLESMALVASRRRVGVTVQPMDRWNVYDPRVIRWRLAGPERLAQLTSISQLRRAVEPLAARLAAGRATADQVRELSAAAGGMAHTARVPDLLEYLQHDIVFHTTLLAASGNEMMAALAPVVGEVLAGRTHHDLMPATPEPLAVALHAAVATAVASGDEDRAESAMRAIVDEAQQAVAEIAAAEGAVAEGSPAGSAVAEGVPAEGAAG